MLGFFIKRNKRLKNSFKALSIFRRAIVGFFIIVFGISLIMFLTSGDDNSSYISVYNKKNYYEEIDREKIPEVNADGTYNGLNLLLINQMSDGYCKEYLQLCVDLQDGKLGQLNVNPGVARTLGVAATEQGTYPNLPILGSPLPLSQGLPVWDKSKNMTLSTAYQEEYLKNGYSSDFVLPGGYFGPWQVNSSYTSWLSKSSISKKSSVDMYYFPDQMFSFAQVRDEKYVAVDSTFSGIQLDDGVRDMLTSIAYSGSPYYKYLPGNSAQEKYDCAKELYDLIQKDWTDKYMKLLSQAEMGGGWLSKFVSILLCVEKGGTISNQTYNYVFGGSQTRLCRKMLEIWGIQDSLESFLSKAIDSNIPAQGNATGMMKLKINGKEHTFVPESIGHYLGEEVLGNYYYGSMLKFAGVNVDPTNPSDYLNSLPADEWQPAGSTDWLREEGVDPTKLSSKRLKVLNEAYALIGTPYDQAYRTDYPPKDANGNYIVSAGHFDCSSYVQYVVQTTLNIDVGYYTGAQETNPNLEQINQSDVQAGDVMMRISNTNGHGDAHIVFVLKDLGNGYVRALHCPRKGELTQISDYSCSRPGNTYKFFRIKGVDG